jgi:hypothetical protein
MEMHNTRLLVKEQWDSYARDVVPKNASREQITETRRAFYAGAGSVLFGVIAAFAPEAEPTTADLQVMEDIQTELWAFNELVKKGVA